ncbi:protoheme IX farnesyltransferase [Anaplasmataceae bacterium AB001_6]|nr:protoheme IX farnesyltransferase [Anaplasmataceae bacterium AB001_6]
MSDFKMSTVYNYVILSKPGISFLAAFSALIGILLSFDLYKVNVYDILLILLAVLAGSSGSSAYNMLYDVDIDTKMGKRTKNRPLVIGSISKRSALIFASFMSLISIVILYVKFNFLSSFLMILAIIMYAAVYTIICKRNYDRNTEIGSIVGFLPPLIGYSAITGSVGSVFSLPFLISAIVCVWSMPHFWSLAIKNIDEYSKVSIPMMPVKKGILVTKYYIVFYSLLLSILSILPCIKLSNNHSMSIFFPLGKFYIMTCFFLNIYLIYSSFRLLFRTSYAYNFFKFSIFYLLILFFSIIFDILV